MELCGTCNQNPVSVFKWNECESCYAKRVYEKKGPYYKRCSPETVKKNALKKYGKSFLRDLESDPNFAEIGKKYGLSRQRVHQIYQILFGE